MIQRQGAVARHGPALRGDAPSSRGRWSGWIFSRWRTGWSRSARAAWRAALDLWGVCGAEPRGASVLPGRSPAAQGREEPSRWRAGSSASDGPRDAAGLTGAGGSGRGRGGRPAW